MLSKQNEGKVLIIGHQHDEVVVPEVLDKYLTNNDKDQTIVFCDEVFIETLNANVENFKKYENDPFLQKCYKAQTEEDKKLRQNLYYETIDTMDQMKSCMFFIGTRYNFYIKYREMIIALQKQSNIQYFNIDTQDPKSHLSGDIKIRDKIMASNIMKHITKDAIVIVSVGLFHVKGIELLLREKGIDNISSICCGHKEMIKTAQIQSSPDYKKLKFNTLEETLKNEYISLRTKQEQTFDARELEDFLKTGMEKYQEFAVGNNRPITWGQLQKKFSFVKCQDGNKPPHAIRIKSSDLNNTSIRRSFNIDRKSVELKQETAKEQIQALKDLKLVTIETTSDSKLLITYPLSLEKEVEKIVMNFKEYQAQQTTSFVKLTEEIKNNSNTSQQI